MWTAVLAGAAACYLLKLAGLSLPRRVLDSERTQRVAGLLPVALLAALVATQTLTSDGQLTVDARLPAVAVAVAAVVLRAPFLIVIAAAAVTAALVRLLA